MIRTPFRLLVLALASALAALVLALPAQAAAPYCGITWGSLDKPGGQVGGGTLANVRAGQHDCYDRVVIDISGTQKLNAWTVGYVDQVREDASDRPVTLAGGARLQIRLHGVNGDSYAVAHDAHGHDLLNVSGYRTLRQVALTGSFENVTSFAVGVRARLPFRVLALTGIPGSSNGTRVVLDVAHAW
jgi:hypothetical protein